MWGRMRNGAVGMLAVALTGTGLFTTAGGATERETFYLVDVYGHPIEPYAELPGEVAAGIPGTYVELQKAPLPIRCESISAVVEPSVVVDGLVTIISEERYQNPSKAWAVNPEGNRSPKAEFTTVPGGPRAYAECLSPTDGVGEATTGRIVTEGLRVESASSDTTNTQVEGEELIVVETTNKLQGVTVGELSIASIMSWIAVEFRPGVEPTVSYKIAFSGVEDGQTFSGASPDGFVLSGESVGGSDFVEQFNEQVQAGKEAFEPIGKYGLRIGQPRFGINRVSGRYVFEISAADGVIGLSARRNQSVGHGFGMRIGVGRVGGRYDFYGS